MTAGHFIFIPSVLLVGVVIGWILGSRAARDATSLYGLIYPERHLQERLYSILPFLAKHGLDLPERLYASLQLDCPDHRLVVV